MSIKLGLPVIDHGADGRTYLKSHIKIGYEDALSWMEFSNSTPGDYRLYDDYPPKCWDNPDFALFYSVDKSFEDSLCTDRADCFVVAMLVYAMAVGADIISEAPVSRDLLFKINNVLVPRLCNEQAGFRQVKVIADSINPLQNKGYICTGMSCGIDSMYTLKKHVERSCDERLTHLLYFNVGEIFRVPGPNKIVDIEEFNRFAKKVSIQKREKAREVSIEAGLSFIYIDSNLDSEIYRGGYNCSCDYRNVSAVLATSNYWSEYLLADAGLPDVVESRFFSIRNDPAFYLSFLAENISTSTCKVTVSGSCTRLEKTEFISDFQIAQRHLDVCFKNTNCGTCSKCARTMIMLEYLGKLDDFSESLNVAAFNEGKSQVYGRVVYDKLTHKDIYNLYDLLKAKGKLSISAYWFGICRLIAKSIYRVVASHPKIMNSRLAINAAKYLRQ